MEWSDPLFMELYVDLLVDGSQVLQGVEASIDDTTMTIVYRDRPLNLDRHHQIKQSKRG